MVLNRKFAEDIGFESIDALLSKHPPSLIADAIEQQGVYTWDGLGRYIGARDDANKGWVYRFDENSQAYKMRHLGDEELPDRRTRSRVLALLEQFNTYWERAEKSGLPLEIAKTIPIAVPKEQLHRYPREFLYAEKTENTSGIAVPLKLRAELAQFGWASANKLDFDAIQRTADPEIVELSEPQEQPKKRDLQIAAILEVIKRLGFDPLNIPYRGKAKIKEKCLENRDLFTPDAFEHAWKAGKKIDPQPWEVENLDQYKNK